LYLKELKLKNYRNYTEQEAAFDRDINLIVGNNAQGKTNLLEAVYLLSSGKSYRTPFDRELIKWNGDTLYIRGKLIETEGEKEIEIGIKDNKKMVKVNGIPLRKRGELLGNLIVVMFSPEEIKLVKEGPGFRRRFMDQEIAQLKSSYYYVLNSYNRVLIQRNSLLKDGISEKAKMDMLCEWDRQLVEYGTKLIYERLAFIKKISAISEGVHRRITDGSEALKVEYQSCIDLKEITGPEDIRKRLNVNLERSRKKDLMTGMTISGPHREDIKICINETEARKFGSQGQQRTAALSIKLSEVELIKEETGEYPVLLLDDVMSELDPYRQKFVLDNLSRIQAFITCTHLTGTVEKRYAGGKVFYINSGIITTG